MQCLCLLLLAPRPPAAITTTPIDESLLNRTTQCPPGRDLEPDLCQIIYTQVWTQWQSYMWMHVDRGGSRMVGVLRQTTWWGSFVVLRKTILA